jgi:hypothetical protein
MKTLLTDDGASGDQQGQEGSGDQQGQDQQDQNDQRDDGQDTDDQQGGDGGDQDGGKDGSGDSDETDDGAPEQYADFDLPEGVAVDTELLDRFKGVGKELNMTQEQAQGMATMYAELAKAQTEAVTKTLGEWADATKKDSEVGGPKFGENLAVAKKAIQKFGTPELKQFLDHGGAGNHPEVVRFLYRVGKTLSEDNPDNTGGDGGQRKKTADVLYGGSK